MRGSFYRGYLLAVLLVILAFNQVDRLALGLALQSIKVDLNLTDTQLGTLSGIAFTAFYVLMGVPIARWADRGNRVTIIAFTTVLWCVAVSLCGLATNFTQLLLIRIGVAVGEPGCIPCSHSLIADNFSRADRPRAVARFMLGFPIGVVIGNFTAGWLNQLYGWRMTFFLLGLPGLVLAIVARLTLKEPRIGAPTVQPDLGGATIDQMSLRTVCVKLWENTSFRHLLLCFAVTSFFGFGIAQWQSVYFIRQYGLKTGELGTLFAVLGVLTIPATYLGGELASRYATNNERLQLRATALLIAISGILSSFVFLSDSRYLSFGLMAVSALVGGMSSGPVFATIQTLVPSHMRAMSIAMIYFFANLIGMGFGPLATGFLSDLYRPWAGEESIRYALLTISPGYLWAGWHVWRASMTVMSDIEKAVGDRCSEVPTQAATITAV